MKKRMLAAALGLTVALTTSPGWAGDNLSDDVRQELKALKEQNRLLMERIGKLEKKVSETEASQAELAEAGDSPLVLISDKVSLSGVIEVEAVTGDAFDDSDSSDIALATVELGVDATINPWTSGHILLKYEDGASLDVDEGTITIANIDRHPLSLTAGKMYVPFGDFSSNMVSDPLTLELGETNEDAVLVGFDKNGFYGALYAFNGDVKETDKDDMIRGMGANIGFGNENLDTGIGWISNIGDSDGLTDGLTLGADDDISGQVGGLTAHLAYSLNNFGMIAEYLTATDSFAASELAFNAQGAKPKAWNLELSHTTDIKGRETTFALAYQGSDEAVALGLPETRYLGSVAVGLMDYTSLALEYIRDEDYATENGGTGNDAQTITMQLAVEF